MVALSLLVSGLDGELVRLGYVDSTMVWYRGCWRRLEKWFAARGVEEFSRDLALTWVDEACGFFAKEQAGTLKPSDIYLFRVAQMLGDYAVHGAVLRRYSRTVDRLAGDGAQIIAGFRVWLQAAGCRVDGADVYDGGWSVRRVLGYSRRVGSSGRGGGPGVRGHAGGVPVQDRRAETVRRAFLPEVRVRRGTGRGRGVGGGAVGEVPQADPDPVDLGSRRGDEDSGGG